MLFRSVERGVVEEAVQVRGVRGVDADLERLQPVAVPQALEREGVRGRGFETIERGQGGRLALAEPARRMVGQV